MTTPFRKRSEREVFQGSLIGVAVATFEAPDGSTFERDVVHHPGAVSVVPVLDDADRPGDRTVLLVRQYRAAVDRDLLEIPAGKRDVAGEDPALTAGRELEEEVGMRAGSLQLLAEFYNSPGFCDEHSYVYLATDLTPCAIEASSIEEELMTIERVPLGAVFDLVRAREIVDAKSIIGLALARDALGA